MKTPHSFEAFEQYKNASDIPEEYRQAHIRPWVRFFAQTFDIYIFSTIIFIFEIIYAPDFFLKSNSSFYYLCITNVIGFFVWAILEAIFLATTGATLGKALLKVKVRDLNGNKLKFTAALKRSLKLWIAGFGCGIPIVNLFTYYFSYRRLKNTGTTVWDKNHCTVTHAKIGFSRVFIIILLWLIGSIVLSWFSFNLVLNSYGREIFIKEILKENESLPKMVDENVEFTSIIFSDPKIIYTYRLMNVNKDDVPLIFQKNARSYAVKEMCAPYSIMRNFILNKGYQIIFKYNDKNKDLITEIEIKASDCNNSDKN